MTVVVQGRTQSNRGVIVMGSQEVVAVQTSVNVMAVLGGVVGTVVTTTVSTHEVSQFEAGGIVMVPGVVPGTVVVINLVFGGSKGGVVVVRVLRLGKGPGTVTTIVSIQSEPEQPRAGGTVVVPGVGPGTKDVVVPGTGGGNTYLVMVRKPPLGGGTPSVFSGGGMPVMVMVTIPGVDPGSWGFSGLPGTMG